MSININSEIDCCKAYINFYKYNNTMGLSDKEIGEITDRWAHKISSWMNTVTDDENEYQLTEEETSTARTTGYNKGEEETGYDRDAGDVAKEVWVDGMNIVSAGASAGFTASVFLMAKTSKGKNAKPIQWIIAGAQAALAAAYWALQPNKKGVEAAKQMQELFVKQDEVLLDSQEQLEESQKRTEDLAKTAEEKNENCNDKIEKITEDVDPYNQALKALKLKIDSGVQLTECEKDLYTTSLTKVQEVSGDKGTISSTASDTEKEVGELEEEMSDEIENFDEVAVNMEETTGMIEYARSFDTATRDSSNILGNACAVNAAAGGALAAKLLLDRNVFTKATSIAMGILAGASAISFKKAADKEFKNANIVEAEISQRELTDCTKFDTSDIYDESLDYYEGEMQTISELGETLPEQYVETTDEYTEIVTEATSVDVNTLPQESTTPTVTTVTATSTNNTDEKNKKEENEK